MSPKVSDEYKEEKRSQLMASALACFGEKGYEATSVDDIIRHAQVSKGMLYTYFPSKEEILLELIGDRTARFLSDIESELEQQSTWLEKVIWLVRRYRTSPMTQEQVQWTTVYLEFWLASSRQVGRHSLLEERYERLIRLLADLMEEGKRHGEFAEHLDAWNASRVYWAACDGVVLHALHTKRQQDTETLWQMAEDMLLGYLQKGK